MKKQWIVVWLCAVGLSLPGQGLSAQQTAAGGSAATAEMKVEEGQYNFADVEISLALSTLARRAGVSLIVGDNVIGKVTVYLENISPKDAMRLIAESKGYVFQEEKNIIEIRTKEAAENVPLEVRVVTLKYAKAEDIGKVLNDVKSTRGKVQVDSRSNALVISDTPPNLEKILPVVEALDTQTPQVMIEAKFVETQKNPKKDLGINWSGTLSSHPISFGGKSVSSGDGGGGGSSSATTGPFTMGPAAGMIGSWLGSSVAVLDVGELKVVLSYLNSDKDTELLANPRVVTTDNGKANIKITQQYPIPQFTFSEQTASFQLNGFQYKDIGITLQVTPRINRDNFVTLEVAPEVSDSSKSKTFVSESATFDIPIVETRNVTTTVLIKSGNTLAMGGLIREDNTESYTKVPVMGDIPVLGPLFRSKSLEKIKRNLLIFLTPTVLKADVENPTGLEKFYNGLPSEEVYTNDKWMPKDNAKPRNLMKNGDTKRTTEDKASSKAPSQNFGPK